MDKFHTTGWSVKIYGITKRVQIGLNVTSEVEKKGVINGREVLHPQGCFNPGSPELSSGSIIFISRY